MEKEILELAKNIAPSTQLSVEQVAGVIYEIIDSQKKSRIKFEIDEEYIQKAIWVKTVMEKYKDISLKIKFLRGIR